MRRNNGGNYTNPCLTMHQPWASLLVYGIKRVEGRSWPAPIRGCVEVVGCIKCEELQSWEDLPEGVRLEGQSDYCWLCEQPQKLIIPFEMRGQQGVYNLEKKIYEAAVRGLRPVVAPHPVKFPLVDPRDAFSLKPGSLAGLGISKASEKGMPSSLSNAIAGAQAAAVQLSKEDSGDACVEIDAENSVASRMRCALKGKVQNEEKLAHDGNS